MDLHFSIIIAVYNRADMLGELLESLAQQKFKAFEVVVVDDGSSVDLTPVVNEFRAQLNLQYFYKANSGPGQSRNYGMERATGNYFIFLDSDVLVPENYLNTINEQLQHNFVDAFGGGDAASADFSPLQKAISFAMTSVLTTGGIRGKKERLGKFQPRSFNMGISKQAFLATGGFADLRIGEDPDLSMRLWEKGFSTALFPNCEVFHKRRSNLQSFAKQVHAFGIARPILNQRHPKYKKLVFWFPSFFVVGFLLSIVGLSVSWICPLFLIPFAVILFYFLSIFCLASLQFRSIKTGILAVVASGIQLFGYGYGFLEAQIRLNLLGQDPRTAFPQHFVSH